MLLKYFVFALALLAHVGVVQADELQEGEGGWRVVNYWSKSCAPCRVEIPEFNYLHNALEPCGVSVLGVNLDADNRARTMQIAERMGITFPTLTATYIDRLNLTPPAVLPTTYILAPDDTVKAKLIGAQDRNMVMTKLSELGIGK